MWRRDFDGAPRQRTSEPSRNDETMLRQGTVTIITGCRYFSSAFDTNDDSRKLAPRAPHPAIQYDNGSDSVARCIAARPQLIRWYTNVSPSLAEAYNGPSLTPGVQQSVHQPGSHRRECISESEPGPSPVPALWSSLTRRPRLAAIRNETDSYPQPPVFHRF